MTRSLLTICLLGVGCWMNDASYIERRTHFVDQDGDGYTVNDGDCDDGEPMVHPGADEICDGIDNNCDGLLDEEPELGEKWYVDLDRDGCLDDVIFTCATPTEPSSETPENCS